MKAVASTVHSADTLARPHNRNLRAPCCSLMIPKTGSANCFLSCPSSWPPRSPCRHDAGAILHRKVPLPSRVPCADPLYRLRRLDTPGRLTERPGTVVQAPLSYVRRRAVSDEVKGSSPGAAIAVVVLVADETVLVVRLLLHRLLFRIRHHHLLASPDAFFQMPTGEITRVGQGRRDLYLRNLLCPTIGSRRARSLTSSTTSTEGIIMPDTPSPAARGETMAWAL